MAYFLPLEYTWYEYILENSTRYTVASAGKTSINIVFSSNNEQTNRPKRPLLAVKCHARNRPHPVAINQLLELSIR